MTEFSSLTPVELAVFAAGEPVIVLGNAFDELTVAEMIEDYLTANPPTAADATASVKGVVQLAGDLGGTAAAPTVPGLAGKANTSHTHAEGDVTGLTASLAGKAASVHSHAQSDVTGLTAALSGKAATSHTHAEADVTGLTSALAAKASVAALTAATLPSRPITNARGLLRALLDLSISQPTRIVFAGSSTTAGQGASTPSRSYVERFVKAVQAAYPAPGGTEQGTKVSQSANFTGLSSNPGVQGFNMGQGGATSADYFTSGERTLVGAINPSIIVHMVGANDASADVSAATFKANLVTVLDDLDSKIAAPHVHVLVHQWPKLNGTVAPAEWSGYLTALTELENERPASVILVDSTPAFAAAGVPGTDPLGLIGSDDVHGGDAAHGLLAAIIRDGLGVRLPLNAAAATAEATPAVWTSDSFTGSSGVIASRNSDATLGGTAQAAVFTASEWSVDGSGNLTHSGSGTAFFGFTAPSADYEVVATLNALPVGGSLFIEGRRSAAAVSPVPGGYRAQISTAGALSLIRRAPTSGTVTDLSLGHTYTPGDAVGLRMVGDQISLVVNGAVIAYVNDSTFTAAGVGGVALGGAVAQSMASVVVTQFTPAAPPATDAQLRDRSTHTGTQSADTLTDGTTNKAYLATERTKLTGIATGATANSSDATLLARANHTGTQTASTISDFTSAADARVVAGITGKLDTSAAPELIRDTIATALVAGTNVTITPNDVGDTITIDAAGGGGGGITTEDARDAVAAMLAVTGNATGTNNDAGDTYTINVPGVPTYIQTTDPNPAGAYAWWDTTGGNLSLWIDDGA